MKYDGRKHKFAVVQDGYALFGVGATRQAAIEDAAQWITTDDKSQGECTPEDVEKLLSDAQGFHGDMRLITDKKTIRQYVDNI
jgi:hypothetical protein